jgi:plastocyanin
MTHKVDIADMVFTPPALTIHVGDTVTWREVGEAGHSTTSDDEIPPSLSPDNPEGPLWDSGIMEAGQSFSRTFSSTGSFSYHCSRHPMMTGTILVEG